MKTEDKPSLELLRAINIRDAVFVGLGAIIGAGIFVVTGVAAGVAGPAFIVGLAIAGLIAICNALSTAQLAASYPHAGATYEYGYRILNPAFGFAAGWMFLISKLAAGGVVAIGFGNYFFQLVPVGSPLLISVTAILLVTVANYVGVKKAGAINTIIVSVTIAALLYLSISGIPQVQPQNFQPFAPFGIRGIAEASALLFFAFTGFARIATLAEEVVEPEKTIPKAIIITIIIAIILYAAVSIVAIGVAGTPVLAATKSPLQEVAVFLTTPAVHFVITLGASTAMLGVMLSQGLGISRMMFAMSRRKDFLPAINAVHPKYRVPHFGILLTSFIILLLTLFGTFEFVVRTASFTIFIYYSITNIAALKQPAEKRLFKKWIPVLGLAGCLAMGISLQFSVIASGIALLVAGFLLKFFFKKL